MKHSENSIQARDKAFIAYVVDRYRKAGRHDLVWRKKFRPYEILVSELMLQQTQVSRVIPKYKLWMRTYPTLTKLRTASFKDILVIWQGLGYQRRAKALYEIAETTTKLPRTYDELLKLPGIGPYTASALMAFAYNTLGHPLLETNIRTALIEAFHTNTSSVHDQVLYKDLERLETYDIVHKLGARNWYLALMDHGAYLKSIKISHNTKSAHYSKQSKYEGSLRQLRAKILFAITHNTPLPKDVRNKDVITLLCKEGYIKKKGAMYAIC